jgi:glutathione S-transferase
MTGLKLFHNPASPYVRKVRVVLHETAQSGEVELVTVAGHPVDPGSLPVTHNPLGKIPALVRPDGCTLYDSRVICRYFNARAGADLYRAPPEEWEVLTLEATGDGIMDAALLVRYETMLRPEPLRWDGWADGQWSKIARSLDAIEARWMGHLAGPFCIGQIAVVAAVGYLDFRFGDRGWRTGRPALADWAARMAERPSVKATVPPPA